MAPDYPPGYRPPPSIPIKGEADAEAINAERMAWVPLYRLALEYQMQHDAIMYAWKDKASPDAIKRLEALRPALFAACKHARDKSGLTKEQIEELTGPIGALHQTSVF